MINLSLGGACIELLGTHDLAHISRVTDPPTWPLVGFWMTRLLSKISANVRYRTSPTPYTSSGPSILT